MKIDIVKNGRDIEPKWSMHYGATPTMFKLAEVLRKRMTEAEIKLWNAIKQNDWKLNFRRQHPIAVYIADFYCHKIKLVIELDGGYHENVEVKISDKSRQDVIERFGISVLRFKNEEVINNIELVLKKIASSIDTIKKAIEVKEPNDVQTTFSGGGRNVENPQTSPLGAGGKIENSEIFNLMVTKYDNNLLNSLPDSDNTDNSLTSLERSNSSTSASTPGKNIYSSHTFTSMADHTTDPQSFQEFINTPAQTEASNTLAGLQDAASRPQLFVIKIGGNVIDDDMALGSFLKDFASINGKKILVHGGGKIATKIGEQLGVESKYINGRRITDAATIDLVTMVYGGLVNKKIVAKLQGLNCNAIGLTGADANIIPANKRPVKEIDYGFAGDIEKNSVHVQNLNILLSNNLTPVIAPLTHDGKGQILNTNADTIASALAIGLSKMYKVRLIYSFEKKGVLEDVNNEQSVIGLITKEKYRQLVEDKKLFEGILPKIDNAFAAIDHGVTEVLIGDAKDLLQNVTNNACGTLIK